MSIDAVIGECQALAREYVEAMRAQGRVQAKGITKGPEYEAAFAAIKRLTRKANALADLGRNDIGLRIMGDALVDGSNASKAAFSETVVA